MFRLITLLFTLAVSPALAQNVTCATRPPGDNSNACASTAFVSTAVSGGGGSSVASNLISTPLQSWRMKKAAVDQNTTSARRVIAFVGDSWTYRALFTKPIQERLQAYSGNAGVGYLNAYGQGYPAYWPSNNTYAKTGTWTQGTFGLDLSSAKSSVPASNITYTGVFEGAVCIYKGVAGGGSFTWAVDGGATTTVDTSLTSGAQTFTISGLSSGTSHSLVLNVTVAGSAGVEISGCDFRIEAEGVRVHRLGVPGAQVTGLQAALSAADLNVMFAAIGASTYVNLFGTNDQNVNIIPGTFATNLNLLAAQELAATPNADIAYATASNNGTGAHTYTMAQYAAAAQTAANANEYTYIPVYEGMGSYAKELANGAFDGIDLSHPTNIGGQTIANIMLRYLTDDRQPMVGTIGATNLCVGYNATLPFFAGSGSAGPCAAVTTAYNLTLFNAGKTITTGHDITLAGYLSGNALTTQFNVTAYGPQNLQLSTASNNTVYGVRNFQLSVGGVALTGVGVAGGSANVSGSNIAVFGYNPLVSSTDASTIMAFGNNAASSSVHDGNIAVFGHNAFISNNHGSGNYGGLGNSLFADCTSCYNNWGLGNSAGRGVTTGKGNLVLGPVTGLASGLSDAIVISDGNGTVKADYNKTSTSLWTFPDGVNTPVFYSTSSAPTASACGGSPAVDVGSSNHAGKVTFGTATTACTLTFASAFANNAFCTVTPGAQPAAVANIPYISAQSKTAFTISGGTASAVYYYTCGGN